MKTSILICIRSLCLFSLLICLPAFVHAQERLQIADLFSKYGEQKDVTRVELNGSILKSYRMTTYKSLVFKNVSPYVIFLVIMLLVFGILEWIVGRFTKAQKVEYY